MKRYIKASNASITKEDLEYCLSSLSDQFKNHSRDYSEEAKKLYDDGGLYHTQYGSSHNLHNSYQYGYNMGMADTYDDASRIVMKSHWTSSTSMTEDDIYNVFITLYNMFCRSEVYYDPKAYPSGYEDYQHGEVDGCNEAYDDIASYIITVGNAFCGRKSKTSTKSLDNTPEPAKPETAENLTNDDIKAQIENIVGKDYLVEINVTGRLSDYSYARIIKETQDKYVFKDIAPVEIPNDARHGNEIWITPDLYDSDDYYDKEFLKELDDSELGFRVTMPKERFLSLVYRPTDKCNINIIKIVYK